MVVPMVMPRLFCEVFEWAGAVHDGESQVEHHEFMHIGAHLADCYGDDPGL
ncbi:hypothetical protein LJR034_008812 [Caballeronia sp. LjRoot34]|uniref:hypothetical protein n=1 Tax=Caballeronia sp. LjRoot34 TaxID=3342325 RepID=UPI003ED06035